MTFELNCDSFVKLEIKSSWVHCIVGYSAHAVCSEMFLTKTKTIKNFQLTEIKLK